MRPRVIPCLLLRNGGLYKTSKFRAPQYIGDPINAVRIFNDKEVDELAFLDISADRATRGPNFDLLRDIASEAFMPFAYGGGISTLEQVRQLFSLGLEKVILNTSALSRPELLAEIAALSGSSSVVVSIDVRRSLFGRYSVFGSGGAADTRRSPEEYAKEVERRGAGEIFLTSIDREGSMGGYDLELVQRVAAAVSIPVVAHGGAGSLADFREALRHGASAVAAGSMFVYHGKHRAVLITYPEDRELRQIL